MLRFNPIRTMLVVLALIGSLGQPLIVSGGVFLALPLPSARGSRLQQANDTPTNTTILSWTFGDSNNPLAGWVTKAAKVSPVAGGIQLDGLCKPFDTIAGTCDQCRSMWLSKELTAEEQEKSRHASSLVIETNDEPYDWNTLKITLISDSGVTSFTSWDYGKGFPKSKVEYANGSARVNLTSFLASDQRITNIEIIENLSLGVLCTMGPVFYHNYQFSRIYLEGPPSSSLTLTVTKFTDSADGACNTDCSLREAVEMANNTPGADTIILPAGTYQLSIPSAHSPNGDTIEDDVNAVGDLDVFGDLTLIGVSANTTLLDGGQMGRVVQIHPGATVTIKDLTIRNGLDSSAGGGVKNEGNLTLAHSKVTANSLFSMGGFTLGGGVFNTNKLIMLDSEISHNTASATQGSYGEGGGLFNAGGEATLTNVLIAENRSSSTNVSFHGYGGGIYNGSTAVMHITKSRIQGNTAQNVEAVAAFGGGIYNAGALDLNGVAVTGNATIGDHCHGGGILNEGQLTINQSTISDNYATREGVFGDGGGLYSNGDSSTVTLNNSTVSANTSSHGGSGGGLWNSGGATMTLLNSTVSGNTATGNGGGINNTRNAKAFTLVNSTITNNSAAGGGGGIWNDETSTLSYQNTILAGNHAGDGADCQNTATLTSQGHNLVSSDTGCDNSGPGDLTVAPSVVFTNVLEALALNAPGNTATHALLPASPALDAGDDAACPATDQRGVNRPQGPHCDIGAYEAPATDSGFRPNPNGYSFPNYGGRTDTDLTVDDLRPIFGDSAVCSSLTFNGCAYNPAAVQWRNRWLEIMTGGHCYGMAVTSSRFFAGVNQPASFQANATNTYDLQLANARRNIASYFVRQGANPANAYIYNSLQTNPNQVLAQIRDSFARRNDSLTIAIFGKDFDGQDVGHAITPYRVKEQGKGVVWVMVYDNNYPNDANRHIEFNTTNNTWSYDLGGLFWSGDTASHSMGVVPYNLNNAVMQCPWCANNGQSTSNFMQLWAISDAKVLVTDEAGHRFGMVGNNFVSEIPDAYPTIPMTGLSGPSATIYNIPISGTQILLLNSGVITQPTPMTLSQFGPNYAVTIAGIKLNPAKQDQVQIAVDGKYVAYKASEQKAVTLTLALANLPRLGAADKTVTATTESYAFALGGINVGANQVVLAGVDGTSGILTLNNAKANGGVYNLRIERTSSQGQQVFEAKAIAINAGDTHLLDYSLWDSTPTSLAPLTLQVDHGSNGTIDNTVQLQNQSGQLYLPLIKR